MLPRSKPVVLSDDCVIESPHSLATEDLKTTIDLMAFSNSSATKSVLSDVKKEARQAEYVEKLDKVLSHLMKLGVAEDKLEPIFVMVLQSAEDVLHKFTPEEKASVCVGLLKRFCADNETHCKQLIKLIGEKRIKPSTAWRRNKKAFFGLLKSVFLGLVALV